MQKSKNLLKIGRKSTVGIYGIVVQIIQIFFVQRRQLSVFPLIFIPTQPGPESILPAKRATCAQYFQKKNTLFGISRRFIQV